ncbi:hypothetical protein [Terracoccus luteus]|uniref:Uncharacterized protein n=1 Tax=Terracoccus luteus TaxID=53356 RepID=A0A839PZ80_9MICO|nr:hypothetical protein [Terracoccus luteus]MBB2986102.1 hypothetical protein [Terracoccus luteus]MCP2172308.1 hypothetical protein [Terracoccus luteus]
MLAVTTVTAVLTFREPELRSDSRGGRLLIAGSWFVPAIAVALFAEPEDRLGVAAVFSAASIGTGGRPALLMDQVVHLWPAGKEHLVRRRVTGLVAVLLTALVAAFMLFWDQT